MAKLRSNQQPNCEYLVIYVRYLEALVIFRRSYVTALAILTEFLRQVNISILQRSDLASCHRRYCAGLNTVNEQIGSDNRSLSDKIMTLYNAIRTIRCYQE